MRQRHAEDGVARLQQREVHGLVGLRAGMRLHVGVVGAEQLLDALDRQLLGDVDVFAAAVVALARIAFGVLVGQLAALRFHHPRAGVVFRRDQLDVVFLAAVLGRDRRGQFGVVTFDAGVAREHRALQGRREAWIVAPAAHRLTTGLRTRQQQKTRLEGAFFHDTARRPAQWPPWITRSVMMPVASGDQQEVAARRLRRQSVAVRRMAEAVIAVVVHARRSGRNHGRSSAHHAPSAAAA